MIRSDNILVTRETPVSFACYNPQPSTIERSQEEQYSSRRVDA